MDPLILLAGLGIVLSVLKYFGVIKISWFWATIPLWSIPVATIMFLIMYRVMNHGPVA
jgi:hypothetical protein